MQADASKCPRNPIQSESNTNPNPNNAQVREDRFQKFWDAYPRHEAKQTAKKSFDKLNPDDLLLETMLTAVERWKQSEQWTKDGGQFIPHPATWLNQKRWEDEPPKPAKPNSGRSSGTDWTHYSGQRSYEGLDELVMQNFVQMCEDEYGKQPERGVSA
jgi:hypothetical protein